MGSKCFTDRKCCTDRKSCINRKDEERRSHKSDGSRRSLKENAYDTKKRAVSIGYHSKGDDAEKFDTAFEANDLDQFVKLLSSQQTIGKFEERMHPWAEDPKTVGALAGTQMAILASVAEKDNPGVKDDIRRAGALPPLVDFLRSEQTDRVQTAVVALSFLTADCPQNASETQKAGAMSLLLPRLESPVGGMRAASATTLRNICMVDHEYRKEFVSLGGLGSLVRQLQWNEDSSVNHADMMLEAVLNIQDIIEEADGAIVEEYAREAVKAGAIDALKTLGQAEDEEVRCSAEEVLDAISHLQPRVLDP